MRSFADVPNEIIRRVRSGERVALVLLDALGLGQLEREREHPLFDRLEIQPLDGQFPSTTTAHVTTIHFGLPIAEHGLYEWRVREPALDEIIVPLRFRRDIDHDLDALAGALDPYALVPGPTVYERLPPGASLVAAPPGIGGSYDRVATAGAARATFSTLREGLELLAWAFRTTVLRYAYLYWPEIDSTSHRHGPSSPEYRAAARAALDAIERTADALTRQGVTVLVTADHGQVDVSPDRVDYLDLVWPELTDHLTHRAAGSARDVFLHVVPGATDHVVAELATRLGDRATVVPAADLFDRPADRLKQRLADVAVLPAPGRCAWLAATPSVESWNLGSHGGRTSAETCTYLARVRSPARPAG